MCLSRAKLFDIFFPPISISGIVKFYFFLLYQFQEFKFFIAGVKNEKKRRNYQEDAGMVKVLCYMLQYVSCKLCNSKKI